MTKVLTLLLTCCIFTHSAWGNGVDEITGVWTTEDGKAKVEVYHCGERYCGKIVWLGQPLYPPDDGSGMGGKPRVDRKNPDPALRSRPLVGVRIMEGFEPRGGNTLEGGTLYDPESGKSYEGKIKIASPHRLELRGYVGISLFGRTTTWTR